MLIRSYFLMNILETRLINSIKSQIVGLRYFNVFGPHEEHKSRMASVIFHFYNQMIKNNRINIFEGSHGLKMENIKGILFMLIMLLI